MVTRFSALLYHGVNYGCYYRKGKKFETAKDFLLGDEDGTGKFTMEVMWHGVIPDINNEGSLEMEELRERLARDRG